MMRLINCNKGFTLVELLIVVAILGILATLSLSIYTPFRQKAVCKEVVVSVHDTMVQLVGAVAENDAAPAAAAFADAKTINGVNIVYPANIQVSWAGAGTAANQFVVNGQRTDFQCPEGPDGIYTLNENDNNGIW